MEDNELLDELYEDELVEDSDEISQVLLSNSELEGSGILRDFLAIINEAKQEESLPISLIQTKHEDNEWLKFGEQLLFNESILDEKYYEALIQMGQILLEGEEDEDTLERVAALALAHDKRIGITKPIEGENERIVGRYLAELAVICRPTSAISHIAQKRTKILERIYLAISRERERKLVRDWSLSRLIQYSRTLYLPPNFLLK
jgi:hypothetical protein